jgi:hypothetical protein
MMEFSRLKNRMTAKPDALQSEAPLGSSYARSLANRSPASSRQAIAGAAGDRLCV